MSLRPTAETPGWVLVAGDKLLAWPRGREWVKGLDDFTLGVLEQALFLKIKETGLGDILAALLGTVMWESLCRQFPGTQYG